MPNPYLAGRFCTPDLALHIRHRSIPARRSGVWRLSCPVLLSGTVQTADMGVRA